MPAQFLLNLFIAFLWMLLKDEDELRISTFLGGFLVGIVIIFLMHRFFGSQFYLRRLFSIINLLFIFNWELILSSILIIKQILSPRLDIKPGIFTYKTELQGDWEINGASHAVNAYSRICCAGSKPRRRYILHTCNGYRKIQSGCIAFHWEI